MNKSIGILAAWHVEQDEMGNLFLPYTHYLYVSFAAKKYNYIYLIAPVTNKNSSSQGFCKLDMTNIEVVKLPDFKSYFSAQKNIVAFKKCIEYVAIKVDVFYCRVPDPFSWMPALIIKKPVIMHFVGDTIDATRYNEKWSWLKKKIMIAGYYPDYLLTIKAAKKSRVYTNGFHLSKKLAKYGIKAIPVISSTVKLAELSNDLHDLQKDTVRLTYIGYLRYAKGINTILDTISILEQKKITYLFNIVGSGEMYEELDHFIRTHDISEKVILHKHVDNRDRLNKILNESDLFFFPSLSEGSPRVVIEAMSQGVPVLSTPVGSCPFVFKDREDIRFFDFNNAERAVKIVEEYLLDNSSFIKQREFAFNKVKEKYTIETFLSQVFSYEV